MLNLNNYNKILSDCKKYNAVLVAVSKKKSVEEIQELASHGQYLFGENYVQELISKHALIQNVEWHFIGHLQSNKVKEVIRSTILIQSVDSYKLVKEINKQAALINKVQDCLLQIHISKEESKFGLSEDEASEILNSGSELKNIRIKGLMGMATATEDNSLIRNEFKSLKIFFEKYKDDTFSILSMGMTGDYLIALKEGSNLVRIGSAIFGSR